MTLLLAIQILAIFLGGFSVGFWTCLLLDMWSMNKKLDKMRKDLHK